jgi:hypothetical protein
MLFLLCISLPLVSGVCDQQLTMAGLTGRHMLTFRCNRDNAFRSNKRLAEHQLPLLSPWRLPRSGFRAAAPVSDATCGATATTSTVVSADAADVARSCERQKT